MNDQSSGWSPDSGDDDFESRRLRSSVERTLMDRARLAAERDLQKGPRRLLQHAIALVLALALVSVVVLGFDAFLSSVQRVMHIMDEEAARQEQQAHPKPTPVKPEDPMPAYVVPEG